MGRVYHEFSRFDDLDDAARPRSPSRRSRWLRSVVEPLAVGGRVYHYSGYEVAKIRALADREHDELFDWAAAYAEEHFVDLLEIVKAHYFGVSRPRAQADGHSTRVSAGATTIPAA